MAAETPITACPSASCGECPTQGYVHCHFTLKDWLAFMALCLPSLVLAGLGLYQAAWPWLGLWLLLVVAFFGFIEIRVLCSHCPHYAQPGRSLTCWANYGSPKIWKYRPGPMSSTEKAVLLGGFGVIWGLPAVVLAWQGRWMWLIVFMAASAAFFLGLRLGFCSRCMNLACPLNRVSPERRNLFPARNF